MAAPQHSKAIKLVPASTLFVSEPPPEWFGNPANEKSNAWTNANWCAAVPGRSPWRMRTR
jgi:hypothetical protein